MPENSVNLQRLFESLTQYDIPGHFGTREKCLQALSEAKWAEGFVCRYCSNTHYCQGATPYSRRCTRCKKTESATAHTIFHHCHMDLPKAFEIAYRVCLLPTTPASEISQLMDTRHMTCLTFKKKILACVQSQSKPEEWVHVSKLQVQLPGAG